MKTTIHRKVHHDVIISQYQYDIIKLPHPNAFKVYIHYIFLDFPSVITPLLWVSRTSDYKADESWIHFALRTDKSNHFVSVQQCGRRYPAKFFCSAAIYQLFETSWNIYSKTRQMWELYNPADSADTYIFNRRVLLNILKITQPGILQIYYSWDRIQRRS